ncbi:DUF4177 domain-containing protein [Oscillospiraceae bacterium OttesenSCG-928-G22]|nr:DUF4177 domain-containing protein [Oscillospiraceae bacterium OttesenSCG-928-G22]
MERFEYFTLVYDTKGLSGGKVEPDFQDRLNELGSEGWELVNSVATNQGNGFTRCIVAIFKRRA